VAESPRLDSADMPGETSSLFREFETYHSDIAGFKKRGYRETWT